jgi:DNA-binding response OmpR family regulator
MASIAIVEDSRTIANAVAQTLERAGHAVSTYPDGSDALLALASSPPDLAIVDWMLPGMDGLELARQLRMVHPDIMLIMLTARADEIDRVAGLESGADDYMVKPFSMRELEARVKALLRRGARTSRVRRGRLELGGFELDQGAGIFRLDGRDVFLRPREMDVLASLMERPGQLISRQELLERVWGPSFEGEAKTVEVHIRRLREKIEQDPAQPRHIVTVRSRGYRFDP